MAKLPDNAAAPNAGIATLFLKPGKLRGVTLWESNAIGYPLLVGALFVQLVATGPSTDVPLLRECDSRDIEKAVRACTLIIDGPFGKGEQVAFAYFSRGRARSLERRTDEAIVDLTKAITINPGLADAYSERGRAYAKLHHLDLAIANSSEAIRLNPKNFTYRYNRANDFLHNGQLDKAIADYNAAINLNPGVALAHMNRAIALAAEGVAQRCFERPRRGRAARSKQ